MSTARSSMLPAVGFVGLGTMGAAMCGRLAEEGLAPVTYDIDPCAVAAPAARGRVLAAATCADVGAACDVVILMLPDGKVVRDAVVGREGAPAGMLSTLAPGSIVIDMSSSSPLDTLELGDVLAARSVGLVDAPVSGSPAAAGSGGLTIMAGGEDALVARCRPILELLGAVILTGALGSGHATKALNNMLAAIALAASAEALLVARRFGLDPDLVLDVLNRSTGRNDATENKLRQFVLSRTFASGFKLDLMAKDLRTAGELAAATDSPLPLGGACLDLWSAASQRLGRGADNTEVVRELERAAGATLVSGAARGCSQQEPQTKDLQGAHEQ